MIKRIFKAFSKAKQYNCYVFLFKTSRLNLWDETNWEKVSNLLNKHLGINSKKPHLTVRVKKSNDSNRTENVKKLKWNLESFKTWTHSKTTETIFSSLTLVNPSLNICEKEKRDPDFFIHLLNEKSIIKDAKLDSRFLVCIEDCIEAKDLIDKLDKLTKPDLIFYKKRPWGYLIGSSDKDTCPISDYSIIMPMYEEALGKPIGEPKHGWCDLKKEKV